MDLSSEDGVVAATVSAEPEPDGTSRCYDSAIDHVIRVGAIRNAGQRDGLRRLKKAAGAVGEFFEVHSIPCLTRPM